MKTAYRYLITLFCACCCFLLLPFPATSAGSANQVKVLFFYKTDCPPCNTLHRDLLPKLKKRFGDDISILALNTSDPVGGQLYLATLIELGIPFSQQLPLVIIGKQFWGANPGISTQLTDAILASLENGDGNWPSLSGLDQLLEKLAALPPSAQKNWYVSSNPGTVSFIIADMKRHFQQDVIGNSQAVIILISMLVAIGYAVFSFFKDRSGEVALISMWLVMMFAIFGIAIAWQLAEAEAFLQSVKPVGLLLKNPLPGLILAFMLVGFVFNFSAILRQQKEAIRFWQRWATQLYFVTGLIAAGYLGYTEIYHAEAVCGAVGDCNAVQQSPYASLFGFISIAALGLLCHLLIFGGWILSYFGPSNYRAQFRILLWLVLLSAVIFFVYLTFLEPFMIGATCFWCLTAAVSMTLQLLIQTPPAAHSCKFIQYYSDYARNPLDEG